MLPRRCRALPGWTRSPVGCRRLLLRRRRLLFRRRRLLLRSRRVLLRRRRVLPHLRPDAPSSPLRAPPSPPIAPTSPSGAPPSPPGAPPSLSGDRDVGATHLRVLVPDVVGHAHRRLVQQRNVRIGLVPHADPAQHVQQLQVARLAVRACKHVNCTPRPAHRLPPCQRLKHEGLRVRLLLADRRKLAWIAGYCIHAVQPRQNRTAGRNRKQADSRQCNVSWNPTGKSEQRGRQSYGKARNHTDSRQWRNVNVQITWRPP